MKKLCLFNSSRVAQSHPQETGHYHAAGIAVGKVGTAIVSEEELLKVIKERS